MNEREELKRELERELQWVQYRQNMLYIIEEKLLEMKQLAEQARDGSLTERELELVNDRIKNLAEQVQALDSESRRT